MPEKFILKKQFYIILFKKRVISFFIDGILHTEVSGLNDKKVFPLRFFWTRFIVITEKIIH